ncbi:hypothetical protein D1AOALGA4SA_4373 [Olavius algarvensis Delta 1 endosymbiont]|nr:hypothetical protein D1AOALGA4SA_4373 [Olavius algarvensis Delta 1 endosymbiont]
MPLAELAACRLLNRVCRAGLNLELISLIYISYEVSSKEA